MLSEQDQAALADALRERERDVLAQLDVNESHAEPPSLDEEIGRLTRMDALQQQQMALHARRRLQIQLETIRGALARVAEGTLGTCVMCATGIARERLDLVPETPFCVSCQQELESQGRR
jgi:DnaK suppressor protein